MIIKEQKIRMKITKRNINFYRKHGYNDVKIGDILIVGIDGLPKGSKIKVDVKCDYCGKIIKVSYRDYNNYKFDKYSCKHCKQKKINEYNLQERQNSLYNRAIDFCNKKDI